MSSATCDPRRTRLLGIATSWMIAIDIYRWDEMNSRTGRTPGVPSASGLREGQESKLGQGRSRRRLAIL
jgi:hypothetical protein